MPSFELELDLADPMALVSYVGEVAKDWPLEKREQLRLDFSKSLEDDLEIRVEEGIVVVTAGPAIFEVLRKYGLNPVC